MRFAGDKGPYALDRVGRDPAAEAQPPDELAVIDGEAPKRRFRDAGTATIFGDVAQQRFAHRTTP